MLEFIDPFSNVRHGADTRQIVLSIWIGNAQDKKSPKKYLSAAAPENGRLAGLDAINAFISVAANEPMQLEPAQMDIEPGKTFCGLHYLGIFKTEYPE